jgi:hypothetical protein
MPTMGKTSADLPERESGESRLPKAFLFAGLDTGCVRFFTWLFPDEPKASKADDSKATNSAVVSTP